MNNSKTETIVRIAMSLWNIIVELGLYLTVDVYKNSRKEILINQFSFSSASVQVLAKNLMCNLYSWVSVMCIKLIRTMRGWSDFGILHSHLFVISNRKDHFLLFISFLLVEWLRYIDKEMRYIRDRSEPSSSIFFFRDKRVGGWSRGSKEISSLPIHLPSSSSSH
jgi:hypothetical protein